jgi:chemotaxis protein CheC
LTVQLDFDGLEGDALTELVSMEANHAAVVLRKLVGEQVVLSVPSIELILRGAAATLLQEHGGESLVAAWLDFEGDFSGRATLIFSDAAVSALIETVAGG